MGGLGAVICSTLAALAFISLLSLVARTILFICGPNELLIFSGRRRRLEDGSSVGYRVLFGGWSLRIPFIERVDRMDLRNIPIDIRITNAYSAGGIPLTVHSIANVKISHDSQRVGNAIERFLGRDLAEVQSVAKETLEGHLRGVLASLTPEEVNEDRLKFATSLVDEAEEDFARLGLHLDTLKVLSVSDEVDYLSSIGRARIALVLRDAAVAESVAAAEAEKAEAEARRVASVATEQAETAIANAQNEVRRVAAVLEAEAKAEEETTLQAALQARAEAEQALQEIRALLEQTRLTNDVVLPAEAHREAEALRARGRAADIEEPGRAAAEVLRLMTETWRKAGPHAKDIYLIQNLERVLDQVVRKVNDVQVDEVILLDPGDGSSLPAYVASRPAMVQAVLKELTATTGVDVLDILDASKNKRRS